MFLSFPILQLQRTDPRSQAVIAPEQKFVRKNPANGFGLLFPKAKNIRVCLFGLLRAGYDVEREGGVGPVQLDILRSILPLPQRNVVEQALKNENSEGKVFVTRFPQRVAEML